MEYVNVKFGEEAKRKIIEGAELAINAVSTTYGPMGNTVLIKERGVLKSTKDGATVIKSVNDPDPFVQMGIDVIKEASIKTAQTVGDGSTTVAIIAGQLIKYLKTVENPTKIALQLRKHFNSIIEFLNKNKKQIETKEDLLKVATLSANNDITIGKVIAEAFDKVGKDGLVTFQESEDVKDRIEYTEGFRIDNGYESPYFINNSKNECVLTDVIIKISDVKLEESREIQELAGKAYKENKSLLLIAPEFDSGLTMFLARNMFNQDGSTKLQSCTVISPCFGAMREIMLEDMRILFGNHCDKVIITKDSTTFMGFTSTDALQNRIQSIRDILNNNNLSEIEQNFHKKRLANFTSGMATIYVGGYSKVEMKERYDRFEDAIMATQCALDGGILPGGGRALAVAAEHLGTESLLRPVLTAPFEILCNGYELQEKDKGMWYGYNARTKKEGDMYTMGIIEPFLVVKATLENAIAVASTILTTNCIILNDK